MSHPATASETAPRALTSLTDEEQLFRQSVSEFAASQVRPLAAEMDEQGKFSADLIKQFFELGLMGIAIPEAYGGQGGSFFNSIIAVEELSRADASAARSSIESLLAIARSRSFPPTASECSMTVPEREMTAISVVAAPSSQIAVARTSAIGSPAPIAAASGSSISQTWRAPADIAASVTARRSPEVTADGTETTTSGLNRRGLPFAFPMSS